MGGFALLMCFSAVYLQQNYISDIVVGVLFSLAGDCIERFMSDRDVTA